MSRLIHRHHHLMLSCRSRAFSTTTCRAVSLGFTAKDADSFADAVPEYPYGKSQWYKQADRGLYGGTRIQSGNNVSGPFKVKTRRKWHPNVKNKRFWSKSLNRFVQISVTTRVLRTIDKLGGLDEYLLGEKEARIKDLGETGWRLRWAVMQSQAVRDKFAQERERLGVHSSWTQSLGDSAKQRNKVVRVDNLSPGAEQPEQASMVPVADISDVTVEDAVVAAEAARRHGRIRFRVSRNRALVLKESGWKTYIQPGKLKPFALGELHRLRAEHLAKVEQVWDAPQQGLQKSKSFRKLISQYVDARSTVLRSQLEGLADFDQTPIDSRQLCETKGSSEANRPTAEAIPETASKDVSTGSVAEHQSTDTNAQDIATTSVRRGLEPELYTRLIQDAKDALFEQQAVLRAKMLSPDVQSSRRQRFIDLNMAEFERSERMRARKALTRRKRKSP